MATMAESDMAPVSTPAPKSKAQTVKTWLRRAHEVFPLTWLGLLTLVACYGLWRHAADKQDHVLNGAVLMATALVLAMLVLVLVVTPLLVFRFRKGRSGLPEGLTAQQEVQTEFAYSGASWLPLIDITHTLTHPQDVLVRTPIENGQRREYLTFLERGYYDHLERQFTVGDIFGFTRIQFRKRWPVRLRIQPQLGSSQVELNIQQASDEGYSHPSGQPLGELVDMRRYGPGDPVRHILWKVYARSRKLMVREPERAIAPRPAMVGIFIAGPHDEAAASTARLYLDRKLLGPDFLFGATAATSLTSDSDEALEQVIRSRSHREEGATHLAGLLRSLDRGRLENIVLFAPAQDGAWVDQVVSVARHLNVRPTVLLSVDTYQESQPPSRMKRWLARVEGSDQQGLKSASVVAKKLRQAHMKVDVVVRDSGKVLSQAQLDAWSEAQ